MILIHNNAERISSYAGFVANLPKFSLIVFFQGIHKFQAFVKGSLFPVSRWENNQFFMSPF